MKYQLVGTMIVLGLSATVTNAQPPDDTPKRVPAAPTDWQQLQREYEEKQRRAPDTMLQHFVNAIGNGDYESAADDVLGADNDPWVRLLKDKARQQTRVSLDILPLFNAVKADKFTARVATSLDVRESLLREEIQPLLMRFETVDLQRDGEFWKIVPRPQPETANNHDVVAQARDESDGFINRWARLMLEPPAPDEATRQERAAIARQARRAPDTMLQHFVTSINERDLEMAAGDVVGGKNTVWLQRLQENEQRDPPQWKIVATPLFQQAEDDQFTARLTTSLRVDNQLVSEPTQTLLTRFETVDLQRQGDEWRIVPRPALPQPDLKNVEGDGIDSAEQRLAFFAETAQKAIASGRDERDGFINQWARIMPQPRDILMRETQRTSILNLKLMGLGVLQLTQDYDEVYAFDNANFVKSVQPYVKSEQTFHVPAFDGDANSTYQFNPALAGKPAFPNAQPQLTPMIYEPGTGPHGLDYRFDGQAAVCFADGHVALVTPEQADHLVWNIRPTPSG